MSKEVKKSRKLFWIIVIILIVTILFFSTRIYLAVNLLLGNDIVVNLGSDKDFINLKHGESGNVRFNAYMLTNPFCTATCTSTFFDLSNQEIIEKDNFTLVPAIPKFKDYTLTASKLGKGQEYYRFDLSCKGIETFWCRTSQQPRTRSIMITMNYDLNDKEQAYKNYSKSEIERIIQKAAEFRQKIENINSFSSNLSNLDIRQPTEIKNESLAIENSAYDLKKLWEKGYYEILPENLIQSEDSVTMLEKKFNDSNSILTGNVSGYNSLIDNLDVWGQKLEQFKQTNMTNSSLNRLNSLIDDYNTALNSLSQRSSLAVKETIAREISLKVSGFQILSEDNATFVSNKNISSLPEKINLTQPSIIKLSLNFAEPSPTCCLFENCSNCCIDVACNEKNYPVILLHGHAFNKGISAEYSLETFQGIQEKLEAEGYLNAGSVLISPAEKGIWSQITVPVTVRASYYFDIYQNPAESSIIQTKSDSIDTYALRLKDIIDTVKYKTGKSRVVLMTASMGGLVARKYLDIFGSGSVDKLIMIASPNHGIESNIQGFCSLIGEVLECRDISKDSLFLNKLNYASLPNIPIINIIGTGCIMNNNQTGDGIVTKDSAYLEGATNLEVAGTCDELKFNFFHSEMLGPVMYPEVYQKIKEALTGKI